MINEFWYGVAICYITIFLLLIGMSKTKRGDDIMIIAAFLALSFFGASILTATLYIVTNAM